MNEKLLSIKNLTVHFYSQNNIVKAVEDVSFDIYKGEFLGIVGESGCGKTVTALSILRLIPDPPGKIIKGNIFFHDQDILSLNWELVRKIRGNKIAMIFQEPLTALNPVYTIGDQIIEVLTTHKGLSKNDAKEIVLSLLEEVGISNAKQRFYDYPHQFSGGMRQRVMIAMALSCQPELLIADEPTTALDVTVQAQILDLMHQIKNKTSDRAILLITHNMALIYENCDRVIVMYRGKIFEIAFKEELFNNALHPYTQGLLKAIPSLSSSKEKRLYTIPGSPYEPNELNNCCLFYPRCERYMNICKLKEPEIIDVENNHFVRCHLYSKE